MLCQCKFSNRLQSAVLLNIKNRLVKFDDMVQTLFVLKMSMQLLNMSLQLPVSLVVPYNKGFSYQMRLKKNDYLVELDLDT